MKRRDRFGIDDRRQRQVAWLLEVALVVVFLVGLQQRNTGVIVNSLLALGVTQLPAVLRRDLGLPMDPGLVLWITLAVTLHTFGSVGIPGLGTAYRSLWWYDHLTHMLSASVVAAAGYASARAIDVHREDVYLPSGFMFVFILLFVLAFGVFWEVIEFSVSALGSALGVVVLTQYGLGDTMLDLVFDLIGGVIVAVWGTARLVGVSNALAARLDARDPRRRNRE